MRARGFLLGGTSGRTTLNGEGLQHEDGQSQIYAQMVPNCMSYDPSYGGELAVIIQDGLRRMLEKREDVYYYITLLNENYHHPALPKGRKKMYCAVYIYCKKARPKNPRQKCVYWAAARY